MAQIVEDLEIGRRGFGGQNEDTSDDLADMTYAEKFILNKETLEMLASLKPAERHTGEDGVEHIRGGVLIVERSDLPGYDGEFFSGAANKINQVIVHMQVPYLASGFTSKDAPTVNKERTKGPEKGTTYSIKPADKIRIIRTGKEFDINLYAAAGSKKVVPVEKDGKTVYPSQYNQPTEGMRARIDRWISENGEELVDTLEKIGVSVETENAEE